MLQLPVPDVALVGVAVHEAPSSWYVAQGSHLNTSVSDPDPGGSGFKLPDWIRIRIRNPDPESEIEL